MDNYTQQHTKIIVYTSHNGYMKCLGGAPVCGSWWKSLHCHGALIVSIGHMTIIIISTDLG